jgi:hypothetical protein
VSAYALFFRDTQAAIKSHNPSASFGEMSKIVAAMWDSLDDLNKNVRPSKRVEQFRNNCANVSSDTINEVQAVNIMQLFAVIATCRRYL